MSSSSASTNHSSENRSQGRYCGARAKSANWSCFNIAAMVVGFVVWWPIGLLVLFLIMTGRQVRDVLRDIRRLWSGAVEMWKGEVGPGKDGSDNVVFNEFQQTQYDRIHEIKQEIRARSRRFSDFRANAKRRADEEEFNRFMSDTPGTSDVP